MNILFVSAEVAPFVSVGGLSQVMYFLPKSLIKRKHDVRTFTAKYGAMDQTAPKKRPWNLKLEIEGLSVPIEHNLKPNIATSENRLICNIKSYRRTKHDPIVYFLENREYYELRANVFGYKDDHMRFALLSKGCLEWLRRLKRKGDDKQWWPDVIHCNDWHTGYVLNLAREDYRYKEILEDVPIVLTVHNFLFQGNLDFRYLPTAERDNGITPLESLSSDKLIKQNALLRGLLYADEVTTVSPTHAIEVLTPEYAEGLDETLITIRGKLSGILNGLDTHEFNPWTDPIIKHNYTSNSFQKARIQNKLDLQYEFSLSQDEKRPLLAISGRLAEQKGWDLLLEVLPHVLSEYPLLQFIVLGGGDDRYRNALMSLQSQFPEQVGIHLQPNFRLPRKIFAGADIFLIPSLFEPGGIVAIEALRYGSVPLVRRTGGLNDIVTDFNPATRKGNGFSFVHKNAWSLFAAITSALTIYKQPLLWKRLVYNCLMSDFSWDFVAIDYEKWYKKVIEEKKRAMSVTPHPAYTPTPTQTSLTEGTAVKT